MSRLWTVSAAAALTVLMVSTGAGAASGDCRLIRGATTPDTADDVTVCEQATYFHRGGAPVANNGTAPSWNATAPTASDSAAYAGLVGNQEGTPLTQPNFEGSFTGTLDTLRVDAFISIPIYENTGTPYPLTTTITIDGSDVIVEDPADAASVKDASIVATSETGVSKMSFAVKNLYLAMDALGLDTSAGATHQIHIRFSSWYWGDSQSVVWFDSATRPSGVYFNPAKTTGVLTLDGSDYV